MSAAYEQSLVQLTKSQVPSETTRQLGTDKETISHLPTSKERTLVMSVLWHISNGHNPFEQSYQTLQCTGCEELLGSVALAFDTLKVHARQQSLRKSDALELAGVSDWKDVPERPMPASDPGTAVLCLGARAEVVEITAEEEVFETGTSTWSKSALSQADDASDQVRCAGARLLDVLEHWDEYVNTKRLLNGEISDEDRSGASDSASEVDTWSEGSHSDSGA